MSKSDDGYNLEAIAKRKDLEWETRKVHRSRIKYHLRVIADKRLIDSLTDHQLYAMDRIRRAYMMRTMGIGYSTLDLLRTPGGQGNNDSDLGAALQQDYLLWCGKLVLNRLSHVMAMYVIADGHALSRIDRDMRQREGTAKRNLVACLDLWD